MKSKIGRRNFLKSLLAAPVAIHGLKPPKGIAAPSMKETKYLGFLYDSTKCIGCRACVGNCLKVNGMPNIEYNEARDIGSKSRTAIRAILDKSTKTMAYNKAQCMHCLHPACVSACPVSAMIKDPETGIVYNEPGKCIGCRYCMVACPYNVVKFEWYKTLPKIVKCDLCRNTNLLENGIPGCVEACPSGALKFGTRDELIVEARHRIRETNNRVKKTRQTIREMTAQLAAMPLARNRLTQKRKILRLEKSLERHRPYIPKIYGEKDGGGTAILYLASIDFFQLGFPKGLGEVSPAATAESLQGMYTGLIAPLVAFGFLSFAVYHNYTRVQSNEKEGKQ